VEVIHEHRGFVDRCGGRGSLLGGDFVECDKDAWVNTATIVHEGSVDGLDSGGS
jgi:hypothetical protein